MKGAWNLHQLSLDINLGFFVCFSSIASVVGWAGQSNYAAGNAFMDSLAHRRRVQGRPALSINWGPWSGSGMAANLSEKGIQRMHDAGMVALTPESGLEAMFKLLLTKIPQAGIFDLDWSRVSKQYAGEQQKSLLSNFTSNHNETQEVSFIDKFLKTPQEQQEDLLNSKVAELLAQVLGVDSLNEIDKNKNIFEYGVNSLMAMEFKSRLQSATKLKLPATLIMKNPTVNSIAEQVLTIFLLQDEITY